MRCIRYRTLSVCSLPQTNIKQHFTSASKSISLPGSKQTNQYSITSRAAPPTIFLAATSPPNSADISVLLSTGGVMLFMYWFTNFLVPSFLLKDLQVDDKTNEETNEGEQDMLDDDEED